MADRFNFGAALELARAGKKVAREGWNGRKLGMTAFVVYQKAYPAGIAINANTAEALGLAEKTMCAFDPYLMLAVQLPEGDERRGENNCEYLCRPWTPDQRDQLAEDWIEVA